MNIRKPRLDGKLDLVRTWIALIAILLGICACTSAGHLASVFTSKDAPTQPTTTISPSPSYTPSPTTSTTSTPTASPSPLPSSTSSTTPLPSEPLVIGYSAAGRPLEVYTFGNGPRKLMIIAGMHGGYEWNTIKLAEQLILLIQSRPDWIPADVTLYILRSLNPDGEARASGIHGRTNENGVDLNRNWPALWSPKWPIDGCWRYLPVTAGPYPGSEPETLALMQFLLEQEIAVLINYHSAALGIFPGGQPPDPVSISLAEAVASVSDYPYPPIDTGCQFTGQLIDWASMHGIAAVDIELTNHRDTDLKQNLDILHVFLQWQP